MTVRFVPGTKRHKSSLIQGFLTRYHVEYEMLSPEQFPAKTFHLGTDPTIEVDGHLFVDPNVDALKKIFHVD
jgi:hypothetical protein